MVIFQAYADYSLTQGPSSLSTRPEKLVWHGSSTVGIRLTTNYCEAWRTGDVAVMGQAALLQTGRLLGQHTRSCSQHYIVLCIENTYVVTTQAGRSWGPRIRGQVCRIQTPAHTDLSPHTQTQAHLHSCCLCLLSGIRCLSFLRPLVSLLPDSRPSFFPDVLVSPSKSASTPKKTPKLCLLCFLYLVLIPE